MSKNKKNKATTMKNGGRKGAQGSSIHESGIDMPKALFVRLDRIVKQLAAQSRGELMAACLTILLDMCEDRAKRYLPELVVRCDESEPLKEALRISHLTGTRRCGTHFTRALEERVSRIAKRIGWSRNQVIIEAIRTVVQWCEDPSTRVVPVVAWFYDASVAPSVNLKRQT
jgi:metal-responsive CopG/Arc/MetJ family transcriptional regulator